MAIPAAVYGLAMAAPGIIKGVKGLMTKAPQQKISNDTTSYLNKLRQVSKEGLYGQDVKNEVGTDLAQKTDMTNRSIINNATRTGVENSGVVAQQLLQSGGQSTLALARMAKQIAQKNEESKLQAQGQAASVGQSISDIKYQNALARQQRGDDIADSFGSAISSGVTGFNDQRNTNLNYDIKKTQQNYDGASTDPKFLQWLQSLGAKPL